MIPTKEKGIYMMKNEKREEKRWIKGEGIEWNRNRNCD